MAKQYYFFYIEVALRDEKDARIYAFKNVSHIPTQKLVEIFDIDLRKDPLLQEGYFLTKKLYAKNKKFIQQNIGPMNLNIFEYTLQMYVSSDDKSIRKLYKKSLME